MSQPRERGNVWSFALHYWRRRWAAGLTAVLLMMLAVATDAIAPIFAGRIVDALGTGGADMLPAALTAFAWFAALGLAFQLLRTAGLYVWNRFAADILYAIVTEALHKVQRFSTDWHANSFAGGTVRKITRGMWSFDQFEDTLFMGLLPAAAIMTFMTIMLVTAVPAVALFALAMIALYVGFSVWMAIKVLAPRFRRSAAADSDVGASLADTITGNATVKSFGAEEAEDGRFAAVAGEWKTLSLRAWQLSQTADLARGLLRLVMMAGMLGITIWLWAAGQATPGDIALVLTSFFIIGGYLRDIGQHIANLQRTTSEMAEVAAFWEREDALRDRPDAQPLRIGRDRRGAEIAFDGVRFAYGHSSAPIYDALAVTIRPGERVALVGPSGSGKSTFVKLIQRLYDVDGGAIRIDGQDIAGVTLGSLRRAIALVPQDPILFHRSLAVNIAYGKPGASREEIAAAATKAFADEFIRDLPQGYDTLVGERGIKLSGGERQRVAIARAVLADAPILILDEATSSLDSIAERSIQHALDELMRGRTTITVAHRLATVRRADRILVFEAGRIVEQGRHDELMARPESRYRQLYELQVLDLAGDEPQRSAAE